MSENYSKLLEILKNVQTCKDQNLSVLAVFDLDSTLFNVSTRSKQILDEFAHEFNLPQLKKVEVKIEDWGIKEAVLRSGFSETSDEVILNQLRDFWYERFFSNEYLHYDVPCKGAISFVQELAQLGCHIKYLTGRDQHRMGKGSIDVLKKWGFPYDDAKNSNAELVLKPEKTWADDTFKVNWFKNLDASKYHKIYFFENEPVNINAVIQSCPEVEILFLDTTHARKQFISTPLIQLKHFGRE